MANTTISPNMNMPIPTVGVDPGPDWANNTVSCLNITDSHNHTPGQGVLITPLAMDINVDLTMNSNNLIDIRASRYTSQASAPALPGDLNETCVVLGDLYYIDGSGNVVRLTQGGAPAGATGTITGLPSGTASASFAGTAFTFQSSTNTPASINGGPLTIGQAVASGFGVTISANAAQASNYPLTLPAALPVSQSAPVSDPAGNLTFLELSSGSFTPSIAPQLNVAAVSNVQPMFYHQIGNYVYCMGALDVAATADITFTVLDIQTPIAPTFSSSASCQGLSVSPLPAGQAQPGQIYANVSNGYAELGYYSNGTSAHTINYSFSYKIS